MRRRGPAPAVAGLALGLALGMAAAWAQPLGPEVDPPEVITPEVVAPLAEAPAETLPESWPEAWPDTPAIPDQSQAAPADAASLAAMRADLAALGNALQSLRAELRASGPAGFAVAGGTGAIDRMDRMEAGIARLTGAVEAMHNRVEAAIAEGGRRAGDIEFRLCEIEPGCDLGALTTSQLDAAVTGSDVVAPAPAPAIPAARAAGGGAIAAGSEGEGAAMDRARQAAAAGDHATAAQLFAGFAADHPASPLAPEALYLQGEALSAAGDAAGAGKAWLQAFTADPAGDHAAQALLGLSDAMLESRKPEDACLFLDDVSARFAGTPAALEAASRAEAQNCTAPPPADPPTAAETMDPEAAADLADGH